MSVALKMPELTPEAKKVLKAADSMALAPAIAKVERVTEVTVAVLKDLGLGTPTGISLKSCSTAAEMAAAQAAIVKEMLAADPGGLGATGLGKETVLRLTRSIRSLVEVAAAAASPQATGGPTVGTDRTIVVTNASEEDRAFTMHDYSMTDVKSATKLVKKMYNMRLRQHEVPTHHVLKMLAYYAKQEVCLPDPVRVPLNKFKRDETDSSFTKFRRFIFGMVVVSAGQACPAGVRHDGAGETTKFGTQWCSGDDAEDFLKEIEEVRDVLSEAVMRNVIELLMKTLFKSTSRGAESPSLGFVRLISELPKIVASEQAAARASAGRSGGGSGNAPGPAPKAAKAKKGAKRDAPPATPEKPPKAPKKEEKKARGPYADKAGELGPNGLPRMVGGNPAGAPCSYCTKGEACPFTTCSYSHA